MHFAIFSLALLVAGTAVAAPVEPRDGAKCATVWLDGDPPNTPSTQLVLNKAKCQPIDQKWKQLGFPSRRMLHQTNF